MSETKSMSWFKLFYYASTALTLLVLLAIETERITSGQTPDWRRKALYISILASSLAILCTFLLLAVNETRAAWNAANVKMNTAGGETDG